MASTRPTDEPPADLDGAASDLPDDGARPRVLLAALGAELIAFPSTFVREVTRPTPVTAMPGAAEWIVGVAAVRGAVLPVGDLARRAAAAEPIEVDQWFVVLDDGRRAAIVTGVRPVRVAALAAGADDIAAGRENALVVPAGLPMRGLARLEVVTGRGANAPPDVVPLVDVAALLDDFFDPDGG